MSDGPNNLFLDLRGLFFDSATELLQALNEEGLKLEANPNDAEVRRSVRRTIHTLKGDSAAAGYPELSELAHELEDALGDQASATFGGGLAELVFEAADVFGDLLAAYRDGKTASIPDEIRHRIRASCGTPATPNVVASTKVVDVPKDSAKKTVNSPVPAGQQLLTLGLTVDPTCPVAIAVQMLRGTLERGSTVHAVGPVDGEPQKIRATVSTAQDARSLEQLCRIPTVITAATVEEALPPSSNAESKAAVLATDSTGKREQAGGAVDLHAPDAIPATQSENHPERNVATQQARENTLRVDSARIDEALNLVGELIIGKSMLMQNVTDFEARYGKDPLASRFADAMAFQSRVLSDLQKSMMKIRMVPVEQIFRRFPRLVRDTSKACGKEVELEMSGENTDLDKGILDVLAEPLSHLVRNAVDHGIEPPDVRASLGKPAVGTVRLSAYHLGNQVVIECTDDGRGIDTARLVEKAIESGVIAADQAQRLTENETLSLIFRSGISTADRITRISGRGVGMDVVKTVVESLKGTVSVETALGKGTTIRLRVPLTLAIIKALLFRVSDRLYAVPLYSVIEVTRAHASEVHRVHEHEVMTLRSEVLTLVQLRKLHGRLPSPEGKFFVVVIAHGERKFGLIVDQVVGEEEIVIKPLTDHLVSTEFVTGASILGDGSVVLILSVQALVENLGATPLFAGTSSVLAMEASA